MSMDIRLPNITATTAEGKLQQMQSYMYQLVEQLNWALNTVETVQSGYVSPSVKVTTSESMSPKEAEETFNSIKALIIKSADIVKAYEETMHTEFNGEYIAVSDFGTYLEQTSTKVDQTSDSVKESFTKIETITGSLDALANDVKITNGYIKRGILADGVVGIEVGETTEDGKFNHYARFTAERLTFYDVGGREVAYIGAGDRDKDDSNCLYVTGKAVFQGAVYFGRYKADTSDGLAFTWIE